MTVNISGANVIFDGGNPRTWTASAKADMDAGTIVRVNMGTDVVGATPDTFQMSEFEVEPVSDGEYCNGIITQDVTSGNLVTVAQRGSWLMRAGEAMDGGALVGIVSGTNQYIVSAETSGTGFVHAPIGRLQSDAASGTNKYGLVSLNI